MDAKVPTTPADAPGSPWCCACGVLLREPFGYVLGGPKGRRWVCHGCFGKAHGDHHFMLRVNRMVARDLPRLPGKEARFRKPKPGMLDLEAKLRWVKAPNAHFPPAKPK